MERSKAERNPIILYIRSLKAIDIYNMLLKYTHVEVKPTDKSRIVI